MSLRNQTAQHRRKELKVIVAKVSEQILATFLCASNIFTIQCIAMIIRSSTMNLLKPLHLDHYSQGDDAAKAFRYLEGQGATTQNLKNAVLAKQLTILSEILIQSYDDIKIVPFSLLDKGKKKTISDLIEKEIKSIQSFHDSHSISMLTFNKSAKRKEKQDILVGLL